MNYTTPFTYRLLNAFIFFMNCFLTCLLGGLNVFDKAINLNSVNFFVLIFVVLVADYLVYTIYFFMLNRYNRRLLRINGPERSIGQFSYLNNFIIETKSNPTMFDSLKLSQELSIKEKN